MYLTMNTEPCKYTKLKKKSLTYKLLASKRSSFSKLYLSLLWCLQLNAHVYLHVVVNAKRFLWGTPDEVHIQLTCLPNNVLSTVDVTFKKQKSL